jgi:hypothetical protein
MALAGDFGPGALALNRGLVASDPDDEDARTRLARCLREANRIEEAEAEYREVLRRNPKNRIAAGALETMKPVRQEAPEAPRPDRRRSAARSARPGPQSFTGFGQADFAELRACRYQDLQERFAPRMVDLVRRLNTLGSSAECAAVRDPQQRQLFRASLRDVHTQVRHVYVFSLGGRWEPQFNLGAFSSTEGEDWFRIGLGFDLSLSGKDSEPDVHRERVRAYLRRFQDLLRSDRRHLMTGWMGREDGLIQLQAGGPRHDLESPIRAAEVIADCDVERTEWVFCGKWLFPARPDDAAILADPVSLVRTIDRVFAGLRPLYRAILA